jgi:hypothetical protein
LKRPLEETDCACCVLAPTAKRFLFFSLCFCFFFSPAPSLSEEDDWSVSGLMRLQYKGRYLTEGEGEDNKFFQTADLTITENKWNHFRFTFSGDLYQDLDGKSAPKTVDRTRTVRDTWDDDMGGFIYVAQAELYGFGVLEQARLGRQYVKHEIQTTHLDGIDCMLRLGSLERRVKPFFYVGVPVLLYDDTSGYGEASEFGGGSDFFLGRWTRITYEHRYTEEDIEDNSTVYGSYRNPGNSTYQQSALAIRHNLHGQGYGYGSLCLINNKPRSVNTAYSTLVDRVDLDVDATYLYQFERIEDMPTNAPLYTGMVGPIKPYHHFSLDLQKGILKKDAWLSAGTQWRLLDSGEEASAFNHSYQRHYLGIVRDNFTRTGLRVSAQAEYWTVFDDDDEDSTLTFVGSVGYEERDAFRLSAGSSYSLFKYDYFMDKDEKQDVYTVYLNGRYYLRPKLYLDGRYDVDIYDIVEHRFVATVGLEL